jgi:hypothetical protein
LESAEAQRRIEKEVERYIQDSFAEAVRRGSKGTLTIRL